MAIVNSAPRSDHAPQAGSKPHCIGQYAPNASLRPHMKPNIVSLATWEAIDPTGSVFPMMLVELPCPYAGTVREILVAEHPEIGIAGAYPSQSLRAHCEGREIHVSHGTDLMVRHDWRRVGPRPGLFVTLGLAFNERFSSPGGPLNSFHYGWPVPAWRMGQRYLGYENVRDWNFVAREIPIERRALLQAPGDVVVQQVAAAPADTDALRKAKIRIHRKE